MKRTSDPLPSEAASEPALARLCDEIIERLQAGDRVDLVALTREHPEHADRLRSLLPALEALVDLGASVVHSESRPSRGAASRRMTTATPRALGDYRVLREIGRGGMGVVYEAEQRSLNRRVALKVLPMAAALDGRQFQRFQLEAQAAACLHHNNIVPVFAVGTEGGVPYYAMQFIEGRSLADVIAELRRAEGLDPAVRPDDGAEPRIAGPTTTALARSLLAGDNGARHATGPGVVMETEARDSCPAPGVPPATASAPVEIHVDRESGPGIAARASAKPGSSTHTRAYARTVAGLGLQAAEALDHAHTRGILHRDIKPGNLLLDADGRLWVADFGLAQIQGIHGLTLSGDVLGTLRYMSPEQALARRVAIDGRTDVYSLGVTLYELLTLRPAVDGKDRAEVLRRIADREPPPPSASNPAVPRDLETVVRKAMAKEPSERYATAKELADDLRRFLDSRPIAARPPSLADRLAKWARRHTTGVASGVVVLVAAVMGLGTSAFLVNRERAEAVRQRDEAWRQREFARRAVDEMYTEVAEKWLADQPRLSGLQKRFLEKALASYQRFAAEEGSDPQVRYEAIRALQRVGAIQRGLGQHAEAEKTQRQTVALAVDLAGQYQDRPEYRLVLAESRIKLAALLRDTRVGHPEAQLPEAEQAIQQAGRELEALRATIPGDAESRQRLAKSYDDMCGELTLAHKLPEAEAAVQAASEVWQALVKDHPAEFEYRLGLAKNHSRRGMQVMWWGGQNEKAEAALRQAVTLGSDLQAENPGDPRLRYCLHGALANLGVILSWTKRDAEAEDVERRAFALSEGMAADFPDLTRYQEDLAADLNNLARTVGSLGRLDEAVQLQKRGLAVREQLVARYPDIPEYETRAIDGLLGLAGALSPGGEAENARRLLQQAVLRARSYVAAHPKESGVFVHALQELFLVEIQIGDHDAADRALDEWAAGYRSKLADGFDGSSGLVTSLLRSVDEVAQGTSTSPQWREARVRGGYLMFKAIIRELSRQASYHDKDLYVLADVLSTAPEGLRDPQLALKLAERASESKPEDKMTRQSLGWARYRVGDWKGCIESSAKASNYARDGDFFAAMAYWKLGDKARARAVFDLANAMSKGYEDRWKKLAYKQGVVMYPEPWMLRPVRSEAAALLGVVPPEAGTDPK